MAESRLTQAAVEALRANYNGSRLSQASVEVLRTSALGTHVTQATVEVLRTYSKGSRLSQASVEVLRKSAYGSRLSQAAVEVLREAVAGGMFTQAAVEVLRKSAYGSRLSQAAVEVLRESNYGSRLSQAAVEVLREVWYPAVITQHVGEVLRTGDFDAQVTQLIAEVVRRSSCSAQVTQLVAEVLRSNLPEGQLPPPDLVPWPFMANAEFDIIERYGYLSEVLRSKEGTEQRRLLRQRPAGTMSYTCTLLTAREVEYAANLLASMIGQEIGVPLWQYQQRLVVQVAAGAQNIPAVTDDIPLYVDAVIMLWRDPWTWELARIQSIGSGVIHSVDALTSTWPAGSTIIIPIVTGYLEEREEYDRHSLQAADLPCTFTIEGYFP